MDNNETVRRLRWALALDDRDAARLSALGGLEVAPERAGAWRLRDRDDGFEPCPDAAVAALLDGLVRERRGPAPPGPDGVPAAPAAASAAGADGRVDNNAVLKALRIALELRGEDVAEIVREGIEAGASGRADGARAPVPSTSEIGSLMRRPGSRNYRPCGDQTLRRFLTGLGARVRAGGGGAPAPTGGERS